MGNQVKISQRSKTPVGSDDVHLMGSSAFRGWCILFFGARSVLCCFHLLLTRVLFVRAYLSAGAKAAVTATAANRQMGALRLCTMINGIAESENTKNDRQIHTLMSTTSCDSLTRSLSLSRYQQIRETKRLQN